LAPRAPIWSFPVPPGLKSARPCFTAAISIRLELLIGHVDSFATTTALPCAPPWGPHRPLGAAGVSAPPHPWVVRGRLGVGFPRVDRRLGQYSGEPWKLLPFPTDLFVPPLTGTSSPALQFGRCHGEAALVRPRSPNHRPSSRVVCLVSIGLFVCSRGVWGGGGGGCVRGGAPREGGEESGDLPVVTEVELRGFLERSLTRGTVRRSACEFGLSAGRFSQNRLSARAGCLRGPPCARVGRVLLGLGGEGLGRAVS
jgi:hypothetical protein